LPQWMSLIWHMVNRPLPMFCSESGLGLDGSSPSSDDQSSSILCHRQKHYCGPVIRDSSACLLHSSERAIMIQLVATGGCSGVSDDQKKAT
jgi:hypothetical protein